MNPLNKKILYKKANTRKGMGYSGYIVMFENDANDYFMSVNKRHNEDHYFSVIQDRFCIAMDRTYRTRQDIWLKARDVRRRRICRITFMTFFDDIRLTNEFHSLYYHWWTTNKILNLKHFCWDYAALTL